MARCILRAMALLLFANGPALADVAPLITLSAAPLMGAPVAALASAPADALVSRSATAPASTGGSLFSGTGTGLFAPLPPRSRTDPSRIRALDGRGPIAQLLSLIALAEAGRDGYDAVQHGARIRPSRAPTQLTLGEIYAWIDATPGQPHAIGRYQFIPPTLRRVAGIRGLGPDTPFSPEVQDTLALVLLEDAGLQMFEAGTMPRRQFMHNLARIWAGLPLPDGRSYYEGYAGNSAAMTWAEFEGGVAQIWPAG